MPMESIFIQLALILFVAFIVSYIIKAFNQPLIIGYIIAGVIVSPYIISFGTSPEIITSLSKLGIAFLLFMVGLHLNPKVIKEMGMPSLVIVLMQILLTFAFGYFVSAFLGLNQTTSAYIGIALSFSSTIIVMKFLSDKRQVDSLYGKISTGVLIVQDLVAAVVLMFISSNSQGNISLLLIKVLLEGVGLIAALFFLGFFIIPTITRKIASSTELLFLFSITWAFAVAALFSMAGFSIEMGALIAGVVLSISPYSIEISSKIKPLKDFFLIIFFIILGFNIPIYNIQPILANAVMFSAIALIFKPFILMVLTSIFKYTKRTSLMVGLTMGQISEFSLIVLTLGVSLGHIPKEILSAFTLTALITITFSTYMMNYSDKIYNVLKGFVGLFERKDVKDEKVVKKKYEAILFGYNRVGFSILNTFKEMKKSYLVVDFNPDTISNLTKYRVPCVYGDAYDADFLSELPLDTVKIVVSTVPDFDTNKILIQKIKLVNPKAIIILRSYNVREALELYNRGASYVLTPYYIGGEYVSKMISTHELDDKDYRKEKEKHVKSLLEILRKNSYAAESS